MKLRIRGNSIRFRLQRSEVRSLLEQRHLEDQTRVGLRPEDRFVYGVELSDAAESPFATLDGGRLTVVLPTAAARAWAEGPELALEAKQPLDAGDTLRILIEKNLACAVPRHGEDDSDSFPNPGGNC